MLGAAVLVTACTLPSLPASSAWFVREEGSFRRLGGFADLPPPRWTPWEEAFTPRDAALSGKDLFLLVNRTGVIKLTWTGTSPGAEQLAAFRNLDDQVLHQLWTWDNKFILAARPLEPRTLTADKLQSASLLFWSQDSPIFSPLPVGAQVRNPLLINLYVREGDGHWDLLWEKPTSEIQYSRYYPGSGSEEPGDLTSQEFWREADAELWDTLSEDWLTLAQDFKAPQGDTLLTIYRTGDREKTDYIHTAPGPGVHRIFALDHSEGKGLLTSTGTLVYQAGGASEPQRWTLPQQPNISFPYFVPMNRGLLVIWEQSSGKFRSHWGGGWIPLPQGL